MQEAKQTFPGNADGEDDHFREIVVKGTVKRKEDENSLVDSVVILGFTSVFGVLFLIGRRIWAIRCFNRFWVGW